MGLSLSRNELRRIGELYPNSNVIVGTQQRIIKKYFGKSELYNYQSYVPQSYQFLGYKGHFGLRRNKHVDKIEIGLVEGSLHADYKELVNEIASTSGLAVQDIQIRMLFTLGFAVSALLPESTIAVFNGPQNQRDILLSHYTDKLNSIVPESIQLKLTGDTDSDIATLFDYFWHYYPNDLTGKDNQLIKMTMMHGLNMCTPILTH